MMVVEVTEKDVAALGADLLDALYKQERLRVQARIVTVALDADPGVNVDVMLDGFRIVADLAVTNARVEDLTSRYTILRMSVE